MLPASCSHDVSSATPVTAAAARLPSQAANHTANHAVGHVVVHALLAFAFCIGLATNTLAQASRNGMVVAQETRAARVGVEILEKGGNAVDAAVATSFALAVTYPRAGNIGGGGYMVIHLAGANRQIAIDYRETAPKATTRDMFLDENGDPDPRKSRDSALSIGVPGTVAGLALAHLRFGSGRLTLAELMAPAISLARDGIPIEDDIADSLPRAQTRIARWPSAAKIFLKDGNALAPGDMLVQKDLAATLAAIAERGPRD